MMTHPQPPQPSPWDAIDDREEFIGGTWYLTRDYVDTARQHVEAQHAEEIDELAKLVDQHQRELAELYDAFQLCERDNADLRAQLTSLQATVTAREQETCEWTPYGSGMKMQPGCNPKCIQVPWSEVWTHCPQCGKPLEITRLKGESA